MKRKYFGHCAYFKLHLIILINVFVLKANAANYYSIIDGAYTSNSVWSSTSNTGTNNQNAPCNCSPSCTINGGNSIYIAHDVNVNCNIAHSGSSSIRVKAGGVLTVNGNGSISGNGNIIIDPGGIVNVSGNFAITGSGTGTINGTLNVQGNLTGASALCGNGTISVGGTVSGSPCVTITLPITLIDFSATKTENSIHLKWSTASEINNDYFTVERSKNNSTFDEIGKVSGVGNSNSILYYSLTDNFPINGLTYYRLKQTDYDGQFTYSGLILVNYSKKQLDKFTLSPNPIVAGRTLSLKSLNNEDIEIKIFDTKSNLLKSFSFNKDQFENSIQISTDFIRSKGTYYLSVYYPNRNKITRKKFIVL